MGFLAGKTAIITGAGYAKLSNGRCGSIGYGIATAYAKEGANLVITGRNVKKLTDAKEELERLYGVKVVCVSATFEPIVVRAMRDLPFDYQISTRMKVNPDGTYGCEVEGSPVEGDQKMIELRRFANAKWGVGGWELEAAYGDHHSDRAMLAAAKQAFAVCPDRPLSRTARERGYQVLEW